MSLDPGTPKPVHARHGSSLSAGIVWRIWAPPSGASPFFRRVFFHEAEAVKAAIRNTLDHLHAANEEGKSPHQADALCTQRNHVNADIVAVLRRGRDIRAGARCSWVLPRFLWSQQHQGLPISVVVEAPPCSRVPAQSHLSSWLADRFSS
ncbi:hypothetical protein GQ55_2G207700 [Panicum hallii var. hallii]|uniref:Uncharacterized protein n=1 Tax=Panicum hallii var. hallii TaxID=1504633 RepID=A0A2T7EQV4_9POAL|nr:hypothetical protein GQ55_2G207700 [Panicum hallii var. hallii]